MTTITMPNTYNWRRVSQTTMLVGALILTVACNDLSGLAGKQTLPSGVSDPGAVNTPAGARQMYVNALAQFQYQAGTAGAHSTRSNDNGAFVNYVLTSGLLTDELRAADLGGPALAYTTVSSSDSLDARIFPEGTDIYGQLHAVRKAGSQALGALATYDSAAPPALRGQLFAYEGYAEILLADLFCSGVPLSTLDFNKDFTYQPSSTTTQVYQHAITLFDSAIALSTDSTRIESLALIGKARALVDLGQYAAAATLVTSIPTTFAYQFMVDWSGGTATGGTSLFGLVGGGDTYIHNQGASVADHEGINGLPYISSDDPRTTVEKYNTNQYGIAQYAPTKYGLTQPSVTPITVASGIEARLIEAEAALHAGDASTWLADLNQLRTSSTGTSVAPDTIADTLGVTGCGVQLCGAYPGGNDPAMGQPPGGFSVPAGYSLVATNTTYPAPAGIQSFCNSNSWYAPCYAGDSMVVQLYVRPAYTQYVGTGGVAGLTPLTDPGSDSARVTVLFNERAYWLFLTGERQGDLRRLVRNYGRNPETVYPTGSYPLGGALLRYGTDVSLQIPHTEFVNPLYRGCLSRGA